MVNPETATSLGPAIAYASAHDVQLVSVDTIVGVGNVYMVVRASNTAYGQDACAYISSKVKSGYVLDLEGDLTSSNGADRTNAFNSCMAANDPNVKVLKDPTVWTDATAVTDAQNAVNAYGSQLKAIYSQWSSPDTGILPLLKSKGLHAARQPRDPGQRRRRAVRDVRHRQGTGRRLPVPAGQPLRPVRAEVRGRRGQGRQAHGRAIRAAARRPCRTSATRATPTSADPIVAPFVTKAAHDADRAARSTGCPAASAPPRSPTATCGATSTAPPTAVCAAAPSRTDAPGPAAAPTTAGAAARQRHGRRIDAHRPGGRGHRDRQAVRQHPRAARRRPRARRRPLPRPGRPQRRRQVDAGLDPAGCSLPTRAGPSTASPLRRCSGRLAGRIATVLPALDGRARS